MLSGRGIVNGRRGARSWRRDIAPAGPSGRKKGKFYFNSDVCILDIANSHIEESPVSRQAGATNREIEVTPAMIEVGGEAAREWLDNPATRLCLDEGGYGDISLLVNMIAHRIRKLD